MSAKKTENDAKMEALRQERDNLSKQLSQLTFQHADIPAGQIKEEPQVPPMYFDRLHGEQASDSEELTTPSMVRRKQPRRPAPLCHPIRDQSGCMILI